MSVAYRSVAKLVFGAVIALAVGGVGPASAEPLGAHFDCAIGNSFDGFGLNIWALPGRQHALLGLVEELRVKVVRWKMLPDLESADIPEEASFDALLEWIERFALTRGRVAKKGGDFDFFRQLQSLGLSQVAASWAVPREWRVGGAAAGDGKMRPIEPKHVDDYGRLLAAQLAVLERHGTRPYAIELLNEPVTKLPPQQYSRLVNSFRSWRRRSALPEIKVAGPGTVFTWENERYLQAVNAAGRKLDIVTTHAWDSIKTRQLAALRPLTVSIPAGWNTPIFVTEYGIDAGRWYHTPYAAGPRDEADSPSAVDDIPFGAATAAQTLALLGSGANSVLYWEAQDPPWSKRQWGLLSKDDRRRPAVDALRTILRPLEVGDRIASAGRREEALPAMLVARPSQLVLQIANPKPEPQDYDISLRNCTVGPISVARKDVWPAGREVAAAPKAGAEAGLRITVPGDTVVSLTTNR